jgi:hypothetical protein
MTKFAPRPRIRGMTVFPPKPLIRGMTIPTKPLIRPSATFSPQAGRRGCRTYSHLSTIIDGGSNRWLARSSPLPACGERARVRGNAAMQQSRMLRNASGPATTGFAGMDKGVCA